MGWHISIQRQKVNCKYSSLLSHLLKFTLITGGYHYVFTIITESPVLPYDRPKSDMAHNGISQHKYLAPLPNLRAQVKLHGCHDDVMLIWLKRGYIALTYLSYFEWLAFQDDKSRSRSFCAGIWTQLSRENVWRKQKISFLFRDTWDLILHI